MDIVKNGFMIGKIYLTNLKSCRYRHLRTENPPTVRVENAQISWGGGGEIRKRRHVVGAIEQQHS